VMNCSGGSQATRSGSATPAQPSRAHQRPSGKALPGLAAHDHRLAHGNGEEVGHIGLEPPRQPPSRPIMPFRARAIGPAVRRGTGMGGVTLPTLPESLSGGKRTSFGAPSPDTLCSSTRYRAAALPLSVAQTPGALRLLRTVQRPATLASDGSLTRKTRLPACRSLARGTPSMLPHQDQRRDQA